jgi:membrane protease YdiL (CAAX protease family)
MVVYFWVADLDEVLAVKVILWSALGVGCAFWYHLTGGTWFTRSRRILRVVLVFIAMLVAGFAALLVVSLMMPEMPAPPSSWPSMSFTLAVIDLGWKPLIEELVLTGFVYQAGLRRGVLVAALATISADVGLHLIHHDLAYTLRLVPAGLIAVGLRWWSGGVAGPVVFHMAYDAVLT